MLKESFILMTAILVFSALLNGLARLIETVREIEKERTWKQKV